MRILLSFLISSFATVCSAQSITPERIEIAKKTVGRIILGESPFTGTGFFISSTGEVLTCWHVIQPSITLDSVGNLKNIGRIFFEMLSGESIELVLPDDFFKNPILNELAVGSDFCMLRPAKRLKDPVPFLRLGRFENVAEGEDIYTVGYPLGMTNQFRSKGILSTKFTDSISLLNSGKSKVFRKNVALLDLTINKGNSGGPIIKFGTSAKDDQVIGIASFLINPFGPTAAKFVEDISDPKLNMTIQNPNGSWVNLTEAFKLFGNAVVYSSNGISGCVSINYFLQALK